MAQWTVTRWILYPFSLIGTIFHEFGHAFMCWVTGGKVRSIQISYNESGLTRFSGGSHCMILPAGYIGSSLAGGILLFCSFGKRTARYTSLALILILLITLWWAEGWFTRIASVGLSASLGALCWWAHYHQEQAGPWLEWFMMLMGALAAQISIWNIAGSTIWHTIEGSDAVEFARQCSVLLPAVFYGVLWLIISLLLMAISIFAGLIVFK